MIVTYLTTQRPPLLGAIPRDGLIRIAPFDERTPINGKPCWGYCVYNRELTQKEMDDYELYRVKGD